MLFNSWNFVALLAATAVVYFAFGHLAPKRIATAVQISVLIIASFIFYGAGDPRLIVLLAGSAGGNVLASSMLLRSTDPIRRRQITRVAVAGNLLLLGFFKYAALFVGSILPSQLDGNVVPFLKGIPLPIGISFYTFQGISLIVDLYRSDEVTTRTLRENLAAGYTNFAARITLYIAFFPQLVAGPIVAAHDFVDQIGLKRLRDVNVDFAVRSLVVGAFLKMVIADNIKEETAFLLAGDFTGVSKLELTMLTIGYSTQIFADFAGYSLLALGLAAMLGYELPINFNYPYISASITEFWRRWHISLSSWLRNYLYITLGGNRLSVRRTYFNLFIVMTLGGLWHGASWNFAVWGFAHGVILAVERFVSGGSPSAPRNLIARLARVGATFTTVTALWLLFALENFGVTMEFVRQFIRGPLGSPGSIPPQLLFSVPLFSLPVFLYHLHGAGLGLDSLRRGLAGHVTIPRLNVFRPALVGVLLFLVITNAGTPGEFIYFQF